MDQVLGKLLHIRDERLVWDVLASGNHRCRIYLGKDPVTGKAARPSGTGRTKQAALDNLIGKLSQRIDPAPVSDWADRPLAEWMEDWWRRRSPQIKKEGTRRARANQVKHVSAFLGHIKLRDLDVEAIDSYVRMCQQGVPRKRLEAAGIRCHQTTRVYGANTISGFLSVLNMALKDAVTRRIIPSAVTLYYQMPLPANFPGTYEADTEEGSGVRGKKIQRFHADEVPALLDAARTSQYTGRLDKSGSAPAFPPPVDGVHHLYAALYLAVAAMLRPGEVRGLRWCDVVLDNDKPQLVLRVQHQAWGYDDLKSKSSRAEVPLNTRAAEVLREHRQRCIKGGLPVTGQAPVFTQTDGQPITTGRLTWWFKSVVADAQVQQLSPHKLRATGLSLMADNNVPVAKLSAVARHSSTKVTEDFYIKIADEELFEAVESMPELDSAPDDVAEVIDLGKRHRA